MSDVILGWAETSPQFGAALPNGSCNAIVRNAEWEGICGFPRREDGSCLRGHVPPADVSPPAPAPPR